MSMNVLDQGICSLQMFKFNGKIVSHLIFKNHTLQCLKLVVRGSQLSGDRIHDTYQLNDFTTHPG